MATELISSPIETTELFFIVEHYSYAQGSFECWDEPKGSVVYTTKAEAIKMCTSPEELVLSARVNGEVKGDDVFFLDFQGECICE